jgi:hypothetical protein
MSWNISLPEGDGGLSRQDAMAKVEVFSLPDSLRADANAQRIEAQLAVAKAAAKRALFELVWPRVRVSLGGHVEPGRAGSCISVQITEMP